MQFNILVLPGDGIGPEVMTEALKVLKGVGRKFGHTFNLTNDLVGGAAIDAYGVALRDETAHQARASHAVLFGAVGGPKWSDPAAQVRPEDGLLALRKSMGVYANIRPVKSYPFLVNASPLKPAVVDGVDLIVVRELTGGLYYGQPKRRWSTQRGRRGVDTMKYSEMEIERILRVGFELARGRRKRLTSVDKANVLETSRLWRQIAIELAPQYPDVTVDHQLVDSCAMQLIQNPKQFDVLVMENTFGDILSDEASVLAGSLGMLPSASLAGIPAARSRRRARGFYEPVHGTAPDIAGQGKANPIATVLSTAMMLRYSLGLPKEAQAVEQAVDRVLEGGQRTADIVAQGERQVTTSQMGNAIVEALASAA
ncbi:MAG: 3-isopropylmalate dehydrogenase [Chloroflexi bacterium]|nr:3-isopropylmalate dehydrogenase [Chloroflexota bacterium]